MSLYIQKLFESFLETKNIAASCDITISYNGNNVQKGRNIQFTGKTSKEN